MKVLSVVGARPQFVKLAPIAQALQDSGEAHVIVHTGQHYDERMSAVFFTDLGIPEPDVHLGVGSGSHGVQTGAMLSAMDAVLTEHQPDWVLVYGDTNSTLAGAVSAVKLHVPLAHLEAGLRSRNRRMPEEHNRVLTDHAADLCLAPTELAMDNLATEGLAARSVLVGDVMTDVCLQVAARVKDTQPADLPDDAHDGDFVLATIHRAENTDDPGRLGAIVNALRGLDHPVVLTAHPRLVAKCAEHRIELAGGALRVIQPMEYPAMVAAVQSARAVVTDSGGLQKEAFLLRTPCTTIRTETEWTETIDLGWNQLVDDLSGLTHAVDRAAPAATDAEPYGDGHAAQQVVAALRERQRS
ncbi:MAG: non-hydrolyzing UDP-N-acetylglucosamine 2-epimerase [Nostocoides sp.]